MKVFGWVAFLIALAIVVAVTPARTMADELPVTPDNNFAGFKYQFWNSQLYPDGSLNIFAWVNDDTLLVRANNGPKPKDMVEAQGRRPSLYLWKLGDKPRPYSDDPNAAAISFCAGGGEVGYRQNKSGSEFGQPGWVFVAGPLGQEKPVPPAPIDYNIAPIDRGAPWNDPKYIARVNCVHPLPDDPAMKGRIWVTDPNRQYYLDFGDKSSFEVAQPIVFMTADRTKKVELPISSIDVFPACTEFHQFDGAFLVWDCIEGISPVRGNTFTKWRETNCRPVWRIKPPDGTVEKICLPYGDWANGTKLVQTKVGLLLCQIGLRPTHIRAILVLPACTGCRTARRNAFSAALFMTPSSHLAGVRSCSSIIPARTLCLCHHIPQRLWRLIFAMKLQPHIKS